MDNSKYDSVPLIIIEDHPAMRLGMVHALSLEPRFKIVGESATAEEGLELIRKLKPWVSLTDINLAGQMNGIQMASQVVAEHLPTRVFLVTGYTEAAQVKQAMRSGAAAYLPKVTDLDILINGIWTVINGGYVVEGNSFPDEESMKSWLDYAMKTAPLNDPLRIIDALTPREMQIAVSVASGKRNEEIAEELGLGLGAVKNYVTVVMRKVKVEDRTQLALFALKMGWIHI